MRKKKTNLPLLIFCLVLAVALLGSVLLLVSAKRDVKILEGQIEKLASENDALNNLNEALRIQLDEMFLGQSPASSGASTYVEEDYCSLLVDDWSVKGDRLSVDALAEVYLTAPAEITAKLELWRGDAVYAEQPVTLSKTEVPTAFEETLSVSFQLPSITEGEELQLWLKVEPAGGSALFACAAGWYLDNGELAMITG